MPSCVLQAARGTEQNRIEQKADFYANDVESILQANQAVSTSLQSQFVVHNRKPFDVVSALNELPQGDEIPVLYNKTQCFAHNTKEFMFFWGVIQ